MGKLKKSFSKKCYLLLLAVLIFVGAGYIHSNNIAYLVGFFLLSFLFAFAVLGCLNIKRVDFEVIFPTRVFANTPFKLILKFKNKSYDIWINNSYFKVAQGKKEMPFVINKRGYFNLDTLKVTSFFPICNKFIKEVEINKRILVYPEVKGESLKEFISKELKIGSDEFEDLKRYEGEELNLIHWASVAKGEVLVKKFSSLNDTKEFIFDFNKIQGDKEAKLSQLTKWVLEADKLGIKYKVILDNEISGSLDEILKKIALY